MHFIAYLYNKKRGEKKRNVLYYAPFMNLNLLYRECAELSIYIGVHIEYVIGWYGVYVCFLSRYI